MATTLTSSARGFTMPAEWEPHAGCLISWPSREELWGDKLGAAKRDYAAVATAIAEFETVVMICNPGHGDEVVQFCPDGVVPVELPINDSWARDNGPTFVKDNAGNVGAVGFEFNAWGNRWHPHDDDAALPKRLADWLDLPYFPAPFVLEGGSFFVDGLGTVITTEQCLLNPNRNPHLQRHDIEQLLMHHLGATTVIWLPYGHSLDTGPAGTDGHIDGVLQFLSPGHVLLEVVSDPSSPEHHRGLANLERLQESRDAAGNRFEVTVLDPGPDAIVSYANHYLANGAVIVPVSQDTTSETDALALETLRLAHHHRRIVGVPGETLAFGGGGPHCITQQVPTGVVIPTNGLRQPGAIW